MRMKDRFAKELIDFAYKYEEKVNNPHVRKRRERQREALDELFRRNRTPCKFDNGITSELFQIIAIQSMHCIPRIISIEVSGARVSGQAKSQTERSVSNFIVDFNNYGNVNGNFATWSDNIESGIPSMLGELMKKDIKTVLRGESLDYEEAVIKERAETISAARAAALKREVKDNDRKQRAKTRKKQRLMRKLGIAALIIWFILLSGLSLLSHLN